MDLIFDTERRVTVKHILIFGMITVGLAVVGGIAAILYFYGESIENWLNRKSKKNCEKCSNKS